MRLNRWQRGGIVLSVVWAVVGGIWGLSAVDNPTALQRAFCDAMGQLYARTPDYLEPNYPAPEQHDCYTVTSTDTEVAQLTNNFVRSGPERAICQRCASGR